jgi:hypothetical protein
MPYVGDFVLHLISLSNELDQLLHGESKSYLSTSLDEDMDSHENMEDTDVLIGPHMFGYFFTIRDIDHGEHIFSKEVDESSHHSIPPLFPCDDEESSRVIKLSSYFYVTDQGEDVSIDNEALRFEPMVMSSSYHPIIPFLFEFYEQDEMNTDIYYKHRDAMKNNRDIVKLALYSMKKYVETVKCKLKQAC